MDLLLSADVFVEDVDGPVDFAVRGLGLRSPHESHRHRLPDWGFDVAWLTVGRYSSVAPTRIEVIAPCGDIGREPNHPFMSEIFAAQSSRLVKTHATVIAVADMTAIQQRLVTHGCPHRLDPPTRAIPYPRLWVGYSTEHPARYDPRGDAGCRLEFIPTASPIVPSEDRWRGPARDCGDCAIRRVAARSFVTADLDRAVATLQRSFAWSPSSVESSPRGDRRACFSFSFEGSAQLELVQPVPGTRHGRFLERWGPGPFGIRLETESLDEVAAQLRAHHVPFTTEVFAIDGSPAITVDPQTKFPTCLEIVERAHSESTT